MESRCPRIISLLIKLTLLPLHITLSHRVLSDRVIVIQSTLSVKVILNLFQINFVGIKLLIDIQQIKKGYYFANYIRKTGWNRTSTSISSGYLLIVNTYNFPCYWH